MAGHLIIVEGDFIGEETAEEQVGVLFLFTPEKEVDFFRKKL